MFKRLLVVAVIPLLAGCALFGPGVDDPVLQSEKKAAAEALEEASHLKAEKYVPEKFTRAKDKFQVVRNKHQESPSREIIAEYREAQILANRAALDSLNQQLAEKSTQIENLEKQLQNRKQQVARFRQRWESEQQRATTMENKLDNHIDKVAQLREKFEKQKQRTVNLENKVARLQEERASLTAEKNKLQRKLERYQSVVEELEQKLEKIQSRTEELQARLDKKVNRLRELKEENEAIADEFEKKVKDASVRKENRGVVVNLDTKILFEIGDIRLVDGAKETLREVASVLKNYPDREIRVGGHTDDLPIREAYPSNWELSAHRALKVLKYLAYSQGIDKSRIAAVAYGQFHPLKPNNSDKNRRLNRRVEISLLPPKLPTETKEIQNESK